jgi:hypothetical protein
MPARSRERATACASSGAVARTLESTCAAGHVKCSAAADRHKSQR